MSRTLAASMIVIFISLVSSAYAIDTNTIKMEREGNRIVSVSNAYGSLWEYSENGTAWSITTSENGKLVFKKGYDMLAEGKFKGSKLTMKSASGDFYLLVKMTSDKIKVNWKKTDDQWVLKRKGNKIKAKYNDMDYGKIKLYPDTQKLKVKDRFDNVIVEIKPYSKCCFAPGAFLMKDLSEDQQIFLTLLLFSKNK